MVAVASIPAVCLATTDRLKSTKPALHTAAASSKVGLPGQREQFCHPFPSQRAGGWLASIRLHADRLVDCLGRLAGEKIDQHFCLGRWRHVDATPAQKERSGLCN